MAQNEAYELFVWHDFDVRSELPEGWQADILGVASNMAIDRVLTPDSVTSREADRTASIPLSIVGGLVIARELPWLYDLYRGRFRDLAQPFTPEPIATANDVQHGITLNVQHGTNQEGYECHVDTNPLQGLLFATSHPEGTGGELVVARHGDVSSREEVDIAAEKIHPVAGHLVFFDARRHSHYVRPLTDPASIRVVAAMTYYTESSPEADRPPDLLGHLFG